MEKGNGFRNLSQGVYYLDVKTRITSCENNHIEIIALTIIHAAKNALLTYFVLACCLQFPYAQTGSHLNILASMQN
jgi:hypothetical protein